MIFEKLVIDQTHQETKTNRETAPAIKGFMVSYVRNFESVVVVKKFTKNRYSPNKIKDYLLLLF